MYAYKSIGKITDANILKQINENQSLFEKFPSKLMSIDADAKTVKGDKKKVKTGIIYLTPSTTLNFYNTCPMAELAGCQKACLYSAGRGRFNNVQLSRIRKTLYWIDHRSAFLEQLKTEIIKESKKAIADGYTFAVRFNGTSDIRIENYFWDEMVELNKTYGVKFYDYTKIANRKILDSNVYDLTFSYSGMNSLFSHHVETAIKNGMRIAVVFRDKILPKNFLNMNVINGDETDVRFLDPQGVVVGLYAKGDAKKDYSGFVVDAIA